MIFPGRLQEEEKAKLDKMFRNSEEEWPYGPTHCPEVRRPLSGPHIALSTKMPAPMA